MEVRIINNNEYEIAKELFCECFNKKHKEITIPLLGDLLGLYSNNILIGICQIDYLNNLFENKKQAIINNFCIKNEYRNQGLGNYLLNYCINYLKNKKIDEIIIRSNKNRIYAHMLYKKNDFIEIDTTLLIKELN